MRFHLSFTRACVSSHAKLTIGWYCNNGVRGTAERNRCCSVVVVVVVVVTYTSHTVAHLGERADVTDGCIMCVHRGTGVL